MPTKKRIIEYHVGRLQDKSPDIRLKAIQELELLEALEALEALQDLYHNDPESDVRKAAQKAGRSIFLKHRANGDEADDSGA